MAQKSADPSKGTKRVQGKKLNHTLGSVKKNKKMNKLFDFFGGRKTTFAILLLIIASVFLATNKCTFDQWTEIIIWIFGVYALGNGVEHIGRGLKKG